MKRRITILLAAAFVLPVAGAPARANPVAPVLTITRSHTCWAGDCSGYLGPMRANGVATLTMVETEDGVVPVLNCEAWNVRPFTYWEYGTPTWNASMTCYAYDEQGLWWDGVWDSNLPWQVWLPTTDYTNTRWDWNGGNPSLEPLPPGDRVTLCFAVGMWYSSGGYSHTEGPTACGLTGGPDTIDYGDLIP